MENIIVKKKFYGVIVLFLVLIFTSCMVFASQISNSINSNKVLVNYKKENIDLSSSIEKDISAEVSGQAYKINELGLQLLSNLDKDISEVQETKVIYDKILDRTVTRIKTDDFEIDLDVNGDVVTYKNLDDYSTIDKDKKIMLKMKKCQLNIMK